MDPSSLRNAGFYASYLWSMRHQLQAQAGFDLLDLTRTLACFHLNVLRGAGIDMPPAQEIQQAVEVYRGLLSRGLPTLVPLSIERAVLRPLIAQGWLAESDPADRSGKIFFSRTALAFPNEEQWHTDLIRAHVAVDPRVTPAEMDTEVFDSDAERQFYTEVLPITVGEGVAQFCEPQTPFDRLVPPKSAAEFNGQRVDFSAILPDTRLVVEVDGPLHKLDPQKSLDLQRDRALGDDGWSVLRIEVENLAEPATATALSQHIPQTRVTDIANGLMQTPLWQEPDGQLALQLVLAPMGAARVQVALLDAVAHGVLALDAEHWRIVVVERDVKCAAMAVLDFHEHLTGIFALLGVTQPLPAIELVVFTTPEFARVDSGVDRDALRGCRIQVEYHVWSDKAMCARPADLLLDLAVLQRNGMNRLSPSTIGLLAGGGVAYELRSAYAFHPTRQISASMPVAYPETDESDHALQFFLQNIFRKRDFRDRQLAIIRRALALTPVIGLLPTGAGKSLCYQFAALLQPGMTLVVDPLVSLIVDQVQNLRENYAIDWLGKLHGEQDDRDPTMAALNQGNVKILFLAPERLQIKSFRAELQSVASRWPVPYTVIDEAHCVSEWGHDFRTSYLRLTDTIHTYAGHAEHKPVVIALTGTASLAVLSDVQREIGVTEQEALVLPTSFDRSELKFRVLGTSDAQKRTKLLTILNQEMPSLLDLTDGRLLCTSGPATNAGIVFTPHVGGEFGTRAVRNHLQAKLGVATGQFHGQMKSAEKLAAQDAFTANELALLVATKAYGMGVDKPNIRYTIHYNIPPSLEAFYQEAGRAGRDGRNAWCWILFAEADGNGSRGDVDRLLWFHDNSYPGQEEDLNVALALYDCFLEPELQDLAEGGLTGLGTV